MLFQSESGLRCYRVLCIKIRFWMACGILGLMPTNAQGQADETLMDRVAQLVERLGDPDPQVVARAREALLKLGPRALEYLPADQEGEPVDSPLVQIRNTLREAADAVALKGSRVTLEGSFRLSEALRELQRQTGNLITDRRDDDANPTLNLALIDQPFLKALDEVCARVGIVPSFYSADGTIALNPGVVVSPNPNAELSRALVRYPGPFRVELVQYGAVDNFRDGVQTASLLLEIAWEPRLRPMLLRLPMSDLTIVDDQDRPIRPRVEGEVLETMLRPENPIIEVNLDLEPPFRDAQTIKRLAVRGEVTVPSVRRVFRFPDASRPNQRQSDRGVTVTLNSLHVEEFVWKVEMLVEYNQTGTVLESFRQGMFSNMIALERADGSRIELNGGFSPTQTGGNRVGFEYLFVDIPGKPSDYRLLYETPVKLTRIPLEFEFEDIPLP